MNMTMNAALGLTRWISGFALALTATFATAQITAGQDYNVINPPQATESPGKVEVTEFFWYGCPHCYALEGPLEAWIKKLPADVAFKRVPAMFNEQWGVAGRVHYTLDAMKQLDRLHKPLFDAIQKDNLRVTSESAIADWVAKNGIDAAEFKKVSRSFSVESRLRRAIQLTESYKFDGVPAIAVNGRYVALSSQAKSHERMLDTVDKLIDMARKEIKK
ncbi:MAG: thiol:disulfide interchange protein DsbA/DsbL [Burkholderiales bacterium]